MNEGKSKLSSQKTGGVGNVEEKGKGQVQEVFLRVIHICFNNMLKRMKARVAKAQI